jgi:hypothetical protein
MRKTKQQIEVEKNIACPKCYLWSRFVVRKEGVICGACGRLYGKVIEIK